MALDQFDQLPSLRTAELPQQYEIAKQALAECARIDECADWANKAKALASYAKQADDKTLEQLALRIRARAIRRCGELLQEIKRPAQGGRPSKNGETGLPVSLKQAARDAGLSEHERKTALRLASIPTAELDACVDRETPATIKELAALGTKTKPKPIVDLKGRDPADFAASTQGQGWVRDFVEFIHGCPDIPSANPAIIVRGAYDNERAVLMTRIQVIRHWLDQLEQALQQGEVKGNEDQ